MGYTATTTARGGVGVDEQKPNKVSYSVPYTLEYDGAGDQDGLALREAAGLPQIGDACPFDPSARAVSRRFALEGDGWALASCVVEFSNEAPAESDNPLARPVKISFRAQRWQRPIDRDIDGEPIINSAGDRLINVPPADDSRPVVVISRNLASFDMSTALQYADAVNSDTFLGAAPGKLKIQEMAAEQQTEGDVTFWAFTCTIEGREDGWLLKVKDAGLYETGGAGDKPKAITTDQGVDVAQPVFLDGDGKILARGSETVDLEFEIYRSLPFAFLLT